MACQARPAIVFMKNIFRWFTLRDTSNKVQRIHQRFPDSLHFDTFDDDRLELLNVTFPLYIEELKKNSTSPHTALKKEPRLEKPLRTLQEAAVSVIVYSGLLNCPQSDRLHLQDLARLICLKFIRPLLVNCASAADKIDIDK
ncbi:hypothetical protein HPB52_019993 [Rhipicephalus sanguineus]|uniref:Uncharacterized protein n=1 Tax=Rhipicephalus sanguineus TaxID=34632 RepID=A0A9D4QEJ4_RHISA|nr:hypothetical protein HPB52_019993 [Rhipicephalus sanguineus]